MSINVPQGQFGDYKSGRDLLAGYVESLQLCLSKLDLSRLESMANIIYEAAVKGHSIYCIGNGGSAATASHMATDLFFGRRLKGEQRPKAISLAANVPLMSALSNDVGYDDVFVEQLNGLLSPGDILFAISASGNSENVLRAVDFTTSNGGMAIGLVGFDGGSLKGRCAMCLHVPTEVGNYEFVEDVHHAACHMIASYVKYRAQ